MPTKGVIQRREMNRLIDVGDGTVGAHVLMPDDSLINDLGLVRTSAVNLEGLENIEAATYVKEHASCGEISAWNVTIIAARLLHSLRLTPP